MSSGPFDQAALGKRIAQARVEADLTQAMLASAIGLDRTAVVRIERGTRKVSTAELVALADALQRPIDWFVTESPSAVLSRRAVAGERSDRLDAMVDRVARDVASLWRNRILPVVERPVMGVPADHAAAERLSGAARTALGSPEGPLYDLQSACERVGLLAFSFDLGVTGSDAAYVEVESGGVAVLNGTIEPPRRRYNLAHELGHHLFGDAYHADAVGGGTTETERLIDSFAVHLLLPRTGVTRLWQEWKPQAGGRLAAVAIAATFRTSWTATCNQLRNLELVSPAERASLLSRLPSGGEFLAVGLRWERELDPPSVPPGYAQHVLNAFRHGLVSRQKAVELLYGTVAADELPEPMQVSPEEVAGYFGPFG